MGKKFFKKTNKALSEPEKKEVKAIVKKAIKLAPEPKFYTTWQVTTIDNGDVSNDVGAFQAIAGMSQGTDADERVGDYIKPISLHMRYTAICSNLATGTPNAFRTIVLVDHDADAAAPVIGDVLKLEGKDSDFVAPYNFRNRKRFSILYDKTHRIDLPGYAAASFSNMVTYEAWIKNLPSKVIFDTNTPKENMIYSLITGFYPNATNKAPGVSMTSILKYTDM